MKDIDKELVKLETELRKLRATVKAGGSIENPARIRQIRRQIARLLTRKHNLLRK
jgi:ribosomal protein L29